MRKSMAFLEMRHSYGKYGGDGKLTWHYLWHLFYLSLRNLSQQTFCFGSARVTNAPAQAQGMVENCPGLTGLALELQGTAKEMSSFGCTPGELTVCMRSQS